MTSIFCNEILSGYDDFSQAFLLVTLPWEFMFVL